MREKERYIMLGIMTSEEFDAVFRIMEQSFPTDERRPKEEQRALLNNPRYTVFVRRDGERVAALIAVWRFEGFCFIEHFAVEETCRNSGIGGRMLTELAALVKCPLCLEVEPPEDALTKRRVGFYERHGFSLNPYPYFQPPISKGKNTIPLVLMSSNGVLTEAQFQRIKAVLYREVYQIQNERITEEDVI